jgi:hypothetical protein
MLICTFRFGDGGAERVLRDCRAGGAGQSVVIRLSNGALPWVAQCTGNL